MWNKVWMNLWRGCWTWSGSYVLNGNEYLWWGCEIWRRRGGKLGLCVRFVCTPMKLCCTHLKTLSTGHQFVSLGVCELVVGGTGVSGQERLLVLVLGGPPAPSLGPPGDDSEETPTTWRKSCEPLHFQKTFFLQFRVGPVGSNTWWGRRPPRSGGWRRCRPSRGTRSRSDPKSQCRLGRTWRWRTWGRAALRWGRFLRAGREATTRPQSSKTQNQDCWNRIVGEKRWRCVFCRTVWRTVDLLAQQGAGDGDGHRGEHGQTASCSDGERRGGDWTRKKTIVDDCLIFTIIPKTFPAICKVVDEPPIRRRYW